MDLKKWLEEQSSKILGIRMELLENMAAAYLLYTDIPPDQVQLVETTKDTGITTWKFERRTEAG